MSCRIWFNNSMLYMLLISLDFCWINTQTIWTLIIIIQAIFNVQCPFLTVSTSESRFQSNSTTLNLGYADQMNFWAAYFLLCHSFVFFMIMFFWNTLEDAVLFRIFSLVGVHLYVSRCRCSRHRRRSRCCVFFFSSCLLSSLDSSLCDSIDLPLWTDWIQSACARTTILIFHKIIIIKYRWR